MARKRGAAKSTTGLQVLAGTPAPGALFYGKDRELTGADRDSQEVSVPRYTCGNPHWSTSTPHCCNASWPTSPINLTAEDRRALSPMFWTHVRPYGPFPIKTQSRIDVPRNGARVAPGPVTVGGVAWAQPRGVRAVEVQIDDGPWRPATPGAAYPLPRATPHTLIGHATTITSPPFPT